MADTQIPASTAANGAADPSAADLRIITLAHGSNREDDLNVTVSLEETVGQLKNRIKSIIPGSPPSEQQRLIYLGRPLLDNSATLRSILRLQVAEHTTHTLHLVIRPNATSVPTSTQANAIGAQPAQVPQRPDEPQPRNGPPMPPFPNFLQNMFNPPEFTDHQAEMMQQHMAIHNQQLANLHPGAPQANIEHFQHIHRPPARFPGHAQVATPENPNQRTLDGLNNVGGHHPTTTTTAPGSIPPPMQQQAMTMRVQESIGPNGERIRVVTNSTGPAVHHEMHNMLHPNPVERSASAPGTAERSDSPRPPQMHRTSHHPMMHGNTLPLPHRQFHRPRPIPNVLPHAGWAIAPANPTVWLLSSQNGPQALLFAPGHGYFSTTPNQQPDAPSSHADATTNDQHAEQQPNRGQPEQTAQPPDNRDQMQGNNAVPAQPRAELVLRPQDQPQPQAANDPLLRRQNREGGDIAAFILQRGWLFLRLYMFIFVLSEPGTWRRIILLGVATLICFLPRQNPLTDAFNVARRHFDNLVGPPQPVRPNPPPAHGAMRAVAGEAARADQAANAAGNNPQNNERPAPNPMPTPEEHARRLLQEYQGRNQSFIRGLLHPIEQAVALFLASLIPGVGERHVRAREEARQLLLDEERRRIEAEQQAQEQAMEQVPENETDTAENSNLETLPDQKHEEVPEVASQPSSDEPTASSTGIDTSSGEPSSGTGGGVRQRNHESTNSPPPNLTADW